MKQIIITAAILITMSMVAINSTAQTQDTLRHEVVLVTTKGDIHISLYNETPLHRDNFLKLIRDGFYNGLLFHRVISGFMIQTGDSASRNAKPHEILGDSKETKPIPAEINFPKFFHKRGAVAAARESDEVNPLRQSSESQFYIVYGRRFTDEMLSKVKQRINKQTNGAIELTPEICDVYKKTGGTPHLDGQYTIFGEVTEGMDVVKSIQWAETDEHNRPKEDIKIIKAYIAK